MPSPGPSDRDLCGICCRPGRLWSFFLCLRQAGAQGRPSCGRMSPDLGCWYRKNHLETPGLLGILFLVRTPLGCEVHHSLCPPPTCILDSLNRRLVLGSCGLSSAHTAHLSTPSLGRCSSQTWELPGSAYSPDHGTGDAGRLLLQIVRGAHFLIIETVLVQQSSWGQGGERGYCGQEGQAQGFCQLGSSGPPPPNGEVLGKGLFRKPMGCQTSAVPLLPPRLSPAPAHRLPTASPPQAPGGRGPCSV